MNVRSLQFRLTAWYTLLLVLAAICFGGFTYFSLEYRLYAEIEAALARRVVHLRDDVLPQLAGLPPDALARRIEDIYSPEQNDRFIRISHADGSVLYRSGKPREAAFDPTQIPLSNFYTAAPGDRLPDLRGAQHILLVGLTAANGGDPYIVEMGGTVEPAQAALRRLVATLLLGLPLLVVLAAAGGWLLIRRALAPVDAMRGDAERISFGKLHHRLTVGGSGDAIDHLAVTLNRMLDRLDKAYEQSTRFSADASHELRTPLAILRGELEAALQEPTATADLRDRIGSMLEEAERLSAIVDSLISLARLDGDNARTERRRVDLAELAQTTLDQMRLLSDEKKISVAIAAPRPVMVMGDPVRLRQVVVNLLDNAIKYTMPGGLVCLSVDYGATGATLAIADNGIGITPDALPHIFNRFFRADQVRTRAIDGAGLGLSIVHAICQAHGGTIAAASRNGEGSTFTVTLPSVEE